MKITLKPLALGVSLGAALTLAAPAVAQDAYVPPQDELAEAMAIMEVMFPADSREETMLETAVTMGNQVAESMMTGPIFEEPGLRAIMDEFLAGLDDLMRPAIAKHMPAMMKATAIAYTREFTLEELQDIRRFAATPAGQRYFSSVQRTLADPVVAEVNQKFFSDVNALQQQSVEDLQTQIIEYLEANPEVVERLEQAGVGQED
jgi:hypothetical protein